ncbi:MAG: hypothetical protein ABL971_12565 [Vicinamibacterales bacterium]
MRTRVCAVGLMVMWGALGTAGRADAQVAQALVGTWTLNPELGQTPREVGFGADLIPEEPAMPGRRGTSGAGNRGRSDGNGGRPQGARNAGPRRESREDAERLRLMTAEVREPARHLTIADSGTAITLSDDQGRARAFRPGREETFTLAPDVVLVARSVFEGDRFVVTYDIQEGRQLRYAFSATAAPRRLSVDIQFLEHGGRDVVHRVFEPTRPNEAPVAAPQAAVAAAPRDGLAPPPPPLLRRPPEPGRTPAAPAGTAPPDVPAAPVVGSQRALSLRGLTKVSVAVDSLTADATACGLTQAGLEEAVRARLTNGGLTVSRLEQDIYVLVRVLTSRPSQGVCVSRYDVSLDTHTMAAFSHQRTPALVEVSLLRDGGLTGGAPAAHAAGVLEGVGRDVDAFTREIRDANR